MSQYIYTFAQDSVATLVAKLAKQLPSLQASVQNTKRHDKPLCDTLSWQVCWLQNNNQPVIGLLPDVSWCVYPTDTKQNGSQNCRTDTSDASDSECNAKAVDVRVVKYKRHGLVKPYSQSTANAQTCYHTSFDTWIAELIDYCKLHESNCDSLQSKMADNLDHYCTYYHGLMGFIGYDITAKQLSPDSAINVAQQPCAFMGHYDLYLTPYYKNDDTLLAQDGLAQDACLKHTTSVKQWQLNFAPDTPASIIATVDAHLSKIATTVQDKSYPAPLSLCKTWQYQDYKRAFDKTQYYLYQGDSYQINLTQRWSGSLAITPLVDYLPALYANTQAPYAGYLTVAGFELLSCSPELFFTFNKHDDEHIHIITKPIKGTRPRREDATQDNALKDALINSEKDRSENVMIVDLLRNDLGKYANIGSVHVPKLFAIESFSNVHHLVSTITATIKQEVHPLTVLFDSLPAGSITGTPKKRAVELISELESHPRGAYCGTMGYMNFAGTGQWNVLIRSVQKSYEGEVTLWAGGGITVRSDCAAEYQECEDKVGNLLTILQGSNTT